MSRRAALAVVLVAAGGSGAGAAFCPSYSSVAATNPGNCGVPSASGADPTLAEWRAAIETACAGPEGSGWAAGPDILGIHDGCGTGVTVPARFPCELVEAILMQETRWVQFCEPTTPADQVGPPARTIVSQDCGYGVAQVTTGMHKGETPDWDRARVAGEPLYALEVGLKILADKWRTTNCVGDNRPAIVEDWYTATWAYNGLSFANNPNNPNLDAMRPVCDPNVSCAARPYQEKVWGWMEHPPSDGRWKPLAPAYPDAAELPATSGAKIPALTEPRCAGPTDCAATREAHRSRCAAPTSPDLGVDAAVGDGGTGGEGRGCGCTLGGAARASGVAPAAFGIVFLAALGLLGRRRRRGAHR